MRLAMWVKMTQLQLNEMLDTRIGKYKKRQCILFGGESVLMLFFSIFINYFFFPLGIPFLNPLTPVINEVLIRIALLFVLFEIILLVLGGIDDFKFFRMDIKAKREYIFKGIKKNDTKICPRCGIFYTNGEVRCSKCAEPLDMAYEYMWIEDETPRELRGGQNSVH